MLTQTNYIAEGASGIFVVPFFLFAVFLHGLGNAKRIVLLGDRVEVRSMLLPGKTVSMPLNDLMFVKARSWGVTNSLSLSASVSGDEVETTRQMHKAVQDLQKNLQEAKQQKSFRIRSESTTEQNQVKDFLATVRNLTTSASVGWVRSADAKAAETLLQPYVQNNMRETDAALAKEYADTK